MKSGTGSGGPTIFDVATGAASKGEAFVDAYAVMAHAHTAAMRAADAASTSPDSLSGASASTIDPRSLIFTAAHIDAYRRTVRRISTFIAESFHVAPSALHLASPSFFSRIVSTPSRTTHDEYWHSHVDRKQYGSFAFTALVYLSDADVDFEGGAFLFEDAPHTNASTSVHVGASTARVYPKPGRMMAFTSGSENTHSVARVTRGVRTALTIAFTCDVESSVEATLLKRADQMLAKQEKWEQSRIAAAATTAPAAPPALNAAESASTLN
jgi:hypothetical protein